MSIIKLKKSLAIGLHISSILLALSMSNQLLGDDAIVAELRSGTVVDAKFTGSRVSGQKFDEFRRLSINLLATTSTGFKRRISTAWKATVINTGEFGFNVSFSSVASGRPKSNSQVVLKTRVLETNNPNSRTKFERLILKIGEVTEEKVEVIGAQYVYFAGNISFAPEFFVATKYTWGEILSVTEILNNNKDFSKLKSLLEEADLLSTLEAWSQYYTIFAPTNDAFKKLGAKLYNVKKDPDLLKKILLNHVVDSRASTSEIARTFGLRTITGENFQLRYDNQEPFLLRQDMSRAAKVEAADVVYKSGIIHVIDTVLIPED